MRKYLYLTRPEWCTVWAQGGTIPISLASSYLSNVRQETMTPDENTIHRSPVDITSLSTKGYHFENVRNLTFERNFNDGVELPSFKNADFYKEDGLILSFCNRKSSAICNRLGKSACVAIYSIESLKDTIDTQLGVEGLAGICEYTADHQRNHFLKSMEDAWQDEFRLFWPQRESRIVTLPAGVARRVMVRTAGA